MSKTNKNWYPSEQDGNYYRLMDGVLVSSPMNTDGSRSIEEVEVDFDLLKLDTERFEKDGKTLTTVKYLKAIEEELKSKD
jgi:hypothetical protein